MENCDISQVQEVEKDILRKLLSVCEENNLRIFAEGGTLLGAVRDQHFIPYDDDIDMAMMRDEYDRFMEIGPSCFEYPYFFQSAYTDDDYVRPHIQIRRTDTCGARKEELSSVSFNQGIFIDVFPYDGVPDDNLEGKVHWLRLQFMKKVMAVLYDPVARNPIKKVVKKCAAPIGELLDSRVVYKHFDKLCKKYSGKSDTLTLLSYNKEYRQRLVKREWFDDIEYHNFDELSLPCPVGYDGILTSKYGDWRTPVDSGTYHGEMIFDVDKSYKDLISQEHENG